MTTIKLHTAPGSLQRIDKGIREMDRAMKALLDHARPHVPPEVIETREFQRLTSNVLTARRQLHAVMAIELELEGDLGPEPFEVRV